jgi:hypothetical protein
MYFASYYFNSKLSQLGFKHLFETNFPLLPLRAYFLGSIFRSIDHAQRSKLNQSLTKNTSIFKLVLCLAKLFAKNSGFT